MFKNSALWNTRYKDTSVHMPWREQEAGLLHNRNSCFSPAVNSTWKHKEGRGNCGEVLNYAATLAGQRHSASDSKWRTHGQESHRFEETENGMSGLKRHDYCLPLVTIDCHPLHDPQAHLVPKLRGSSLQRGRAEQCAGSSGRKGWVVLGSLQPHLYLGILVVPVANSCVSPSLGVSHGRHLSCFLPNSSFFHPFQAPNNALQQNWDQGNGSNNSLIFPF